MNTYERLPSGAARVLPVLSPPESEDRCHAESPPSPEIDFDDTVTYRITSGLDCPHCAEGFARMVRTLPGVDNAQVYFSSGLLKVAFTEGDTAIRQILPRRARQAGFQLERDNPEPAPDETSQQSRRSNQQSKSVSRFLTPTNACVALLALGLAFEHVPHSSPVLARIFLAGSILVGGERFARAGFAALRGKVIGTSLLMVLAAIGAVILGQWSEAAMVIALYSIGTCLEGAAVERTRRSLAELFDVCPEYAVVQRADLSHEVVSATKLREGDLIVVKPGARVAADGTVVTGFSSMIESALTGESLPRDITVGDPVFAGALNENGSLIVRVSAPASDSTMARVAQMVQNAQHGKTQTQSLVDRFGHIYAPAVILTAVAVGCFGPLVAPGSNYFYRALTLLVVSCPCALLLAAPVAYVSAITRAARMGVLIKGRSHLEALPGIRQIYLDKTGTLTTGKLALTDAMALDGFSEDEMLATAGAVERYSEHPVARAIVAAADERSARAPLLHPGPRNVCDFAAVPGMGIGASFDDGTAVQIGSVDFLKTVGVAVPAALDEWAVNRSSEGRTVLAVAVGGIVHGGFAVADSVRSDSAAAVADLRATDRSVSILSGDRSGAVASVAQAVGISSFYGRLMPQGKRDFVEDSIHRGEPVAFLGDGINDTPALAAATVGIAMGSGGAAAAVEAADIAIMSDDLSRLPMLFRLAEETRRIVISNISLSIAAICILLVGTFTGRLTLPMGVLAHEGSALLVILNGLRLLSPRLVPLRKRP